MCISNSNILLIPYPLHETLHIFVYKRLFTSATSLGTFRLVVLPPVFDWIVSAFLGDEMERWRDEDIECIARVGQKEHQRTSVAYQIVLFNSLSCLCPMLKSINICSFTMVLIQFSNSSRRNLALAVQGVAGH